VEWVEVQGDDVEVAVEAAVQELGLSSRDEADVEVIQEPQRGFLGMGGQKAIVRVKRRQGGGSSPSKSSKSRGGRSRSSSKPSDKGSSGSSRSSRSSSKPKNDDRGSQKPAKSQSGSSRGRSSGNDRQKKQSEERNVDPAEQATVIEEFLKGLLDSFGFDGKVETRVEDDVIYADLTGIETEALVGTKGATMQAVLELCRTIVQRKTQAGARIRLDVAGYGERRREALKIYATRLAEKVIEDGGEAMLEPMNAADRKVVHDAIGEIDGVRSFSEGEEPNRSVVVAKE
jgi:spoIIIJ-associated protein